MHPSGPPLTESVETSAVPSTTSNWQFDRTNNAVQFLCELWRRV